jgi:hypothetical protein
MLTSAVTAPILRDYQDECVGAIRQAFTRWRRVRFVLPTGGGKTVIFAFITSHAAAKGKRVIVLAHRQEIADQISIALAAMGVTHGRIQPGHAMTDDLVQVGMVQTVARRLALTIWEGITRFFLDNPAATEATPFIFEEGSVERRTLESMIVPEVSDDSEESDDDEEVPYSGPMPEVALFNLELAMPARTHMPRPGAARGLAFVQRRIWELTAAKGAIQRVSQQPPTR